MAEIRQGYLDDYTQITSGNIGIGTSSASGAKLEIIGGTTSQELNVTGIATFGSVSGFVKKHTDYTENVNITNGDSGTLSGEIVVGAGLTMTVGTAATASQGSVDSLKVSNMFQPPSGTTNQRPPAKPGALLLEYTQQAKPRWATTGITIKPQTGDFFMFPALLQHWVCPFKSKVTRISVSGNMRILNRDKLPYDYF